MRVVDWNNLKILWNINSDIDLNVVFKRLEKLAKLYPAEYKSVRDKYMMGTDYVITVNTEKIVVEFEKLINLMPEREHSMLMHTAYKVLGVAMKSIEQVRDKYKSVDQDPPAFQPALIAHGPYENLIEDILLGKNNIMDDILDEWKLRLKKILHKTKFKIITLTNASSTRIQYRGANIVDMLGVVFCHEDIDEYTDYINIKRYFKIANLDGEFDYIKYHNNKVFGRHIVIPDKDGKTREIYNLDPTVQVISKGIARVIDKFVRGIDGNYTTCQQEWGRNMLENNWHRTKLIISTDMSKYSDTLSRRFMLMLLNRIGVPEEVTYEMDKLFSLPVIDIRNKVLSGTKATYQGQYADFGLITLCNLFCAYLTYRMLGIVRKPGYSGAVGDDTVMVFEEGTDPTVAYNMIKDIYNSVGVNINRSKTFILNCGQGHIDFCKRIYNINGIVHYINYKSIVSKFDDDKFDECRRLWNDGYRDERLMYYILGDRYKKFLNLHRLNGGMRDDEITKQDIQIFVQRARRLSLEQYKVKDSVWKALDIIDSEIPIENTELIGFSPHAMEIFEYDGEEDLPYDIKEEIYEGILHCIKYGYKTELKDLERLLGLTLEEVSNIYPELYESINENIDTLAYRDKKKRQDKRVYDTILNIKPSTEDISEVLRVLHDEDVSTANTDIILSYIIKFGELDPNSIIMREFHFGHDRCYFYFVDKDGLGHKMRLYNAESSMYDFLSKGVFNLAFSYYLGEGDYTDYYEYFRKHCGNCFNNGDRLYRSLKLFK